MEQIPSSQLELMDDRVLVSLALEGRQEAYTRLLFKYKDRIQAFAGKLIVNQVDTEDIVLMCFDRAFSNLSGYNPRFAFSTWLYKICYNMCIDHFRRQKQFYVSLDEATDQADITPEENLIAEQQRQVIERYINKLKPEYAQVIRLRYMQHYAYEEMAQELDIPLGTVKNRLHRAKILLGQIVSQEGG